MTQDIRKTINDVFEALQAAALLADCCDSVEALEVPDIRKLAVKRAKDMMAVVERARAGLTGTTTGEVA